MSAKGKGPVDRELPQRVGVEGKVASALGRMLTASTQAGPLRYLTQSKHEFATISYLAVKVQAPATLNNIVAPLLADGGKVTYGTTHENLNGWNLVADVSATRDAAMALPQRIDQIATCLQKEKLDIKKTVFLAIFTSPKVGDVTPKTAQTALEMMRQVSRSADQFHVVFVFANEESLHGWGAGQAKARPQQQQAAKGGKGKARPAAAAGRQAGAGRGGKGAVVESMVLSAQKSARTGGRGGGGGGGNKRAGAVIEQVKVGGKGNKGAKGAKGAKGNRAGDKKTTVNLGDGLTQRTTKAGVVSFTKRSNPY